jgi:hypothetical protein
MANVNNLKRIVVEDFSKDDQSVAQKLAFVYNPMTEQLVAAFNKGIDFSNLNQQYITFTITTASGVPATKTELKYDLKTRLKGCQVIAASNLTDNTYPTATPFISYSVANSQITIEHVSGLPDNKQFQLSVILYG